jgi:hypothetical protein
MPRAKRPGARSSSSKAMSPADDPRFIAVERGRSRREGIPIPEADPAWMPEAQSWFRALKLSGQSEFYEASDWATAVAAARAFDIAIRTHNASWFTNFTRLSERLGVTVVDRQRARIELEEPEPQDADEDAADEAVSGWQARLRVVPD